MKNHFLEYSCIHSFPDLFWAPLNWTIFGPCILAPILQKGWKTIRTAYQEKLFTFWWCAAVRNLLKSLHKRSIWAFSVAGTGNCDHQRSQAGLHHLTVGKVSYKKKFWINWNSFGKHKLLTIYLGKEVLKSDISNL